MQFLAFAVLGCIPAIGNASNAPDLPDDSIEIWNDNGLQRCEPWASKSGIFGC